MNKEMIKCARIISGIVAEKGLSIGELERSVGLSPGYISRCRNGNKQMNIFTLHKIEEYLGVDIYKRMWEDEE